jgi:hypothetical protein
MKLTDFRAGNDLLRLPLNIDVTDFNNNEIEKLIDTMINELGGVIGEPNGPEFLKDPNLFNKVLEDLLNKSKNKYNFCKAYIVIGFSDKNTLKIEHSDKVTPGTSVYSKKSFYDMVKNLEKKPLKISDKFSYNTKRKPFKI